MHGKYKHVNIIRSKKKVFFFFFFYNEPNMGGGNCAMAITIDWNLFCFRVLFGGIMG